MSVAADMGLTLSLNNRKGNRVIYTIQSHQKSPTKTRGLDSQQVARLLWQALCKESLLKTLFLILLLMAYSGKSFAENLCDSWDQKIEDDMQMPESLFSKQNSDEAKIALEGLEKNSSDILVQFRIQNLARTIKGYAFREKALNSKLETDINAFCTFFINEAFYHD